MASGGRGSYRFGSRLLAAKCAGTVRVLGNHYSRESVEDWRQTPPQPAGKMLAGWVLKTVDVVQTAVVKSVE